MSDLRPDERSVGGLAVVLRRVGWGSVCAVAVLLLQSLFHQPVGPLTICLVVALLALTAFAPFNGLLVLASFGPLSSVLFNLTTASSISIQFAETLTLAFIAGWAGRRTFRPRPLAISPGTRWAAVLLLAAAAASAVAQWAAVRAENLGEPVTALIQSFVTRDYLLHLAGSAPITAAALVCEGALLLLMAADACARSQAERDSVLRMMVIGGAAAGTFNVLRIVMVALPQADVWAALGYFIRYQRVNVQYGDLNAAGSYFALILPIAIGLVAQVPVFVVALLLVAAGLWITGSRFGLGGAGLGMGIGALVALRGRGRRALPVIAGLVLLVAAAGAVWAFYPKYRNTNANNALAIRLTLGRAALDMTAHHPFFGVGLGRFYPESEPYLRSTPAIGLRENAHNYFLQILAELGVPGLLLFLAAVGMPLRTLWRSATPLPASSIGLFGGLCAFLLSCLGGHPLIVPESSFPLWIAVGLAAVPLGQTGPIPTPRVLHLLGTVSILALVLTLPYRIAQAPSTADKSALSIGLSRWQHEPDGTRYRWAGGRSTFFVESSARAVRIPVRNAHPEHIALEVRVFLDGREADRVLLPPDDSWRVQRLILTRSAGRFYRIDLVVYPAGQDAPLTLQPTDRAGAIHVGRPFVEE